MLLAAEMGLVPPRAAPALRLRVTVPGVFLAEVRAAAGFFAGAFRLGADFFWELFLELFLGLFFEEETFADFFFETPFLETRFETFLAATFRGGAFFPDGRFLRLLVAIALRDLAVAAFLLPDFF